MIRFRTSAPLAPLLAALFALVLRVMVPAGFMVAPSTAVAGAVEIVLCTGSGNQSMLMAPDGTLVSAGQDHGAPGEADRGVEHKPCAFAAQAAAPAPSLADLGAAYVRLAPAFAGAALSADLVPGRGLAAPPPPATAPPILV